MADPPDIIATHPAFLWERGVKGCQAMPVTHKTMIKEIIKEVIMESLTENIDRESLEKTNYNKESNLRESWIGKYVICRTRNEGVNAGKVSALDHTGVVLEDARRLWYHKPAAKGVSWYEGIAESGLNAESKISAPVTKILSEDYSLTECCKLAEEQIRSHATHQQS